MRKKILALALCLALTAGMAACGKDNQEGQGDSSAASTESNTQAEQGESSAVPTESTIPVPAETAPEKVALENDQLALAEYTGLKVLRVTPEDIEANTLTNRKNNFLASHSEEITNRPAEEGDMVAVDFSGALDGVKFDGGTGSTDDLVLGSGSMIPGFEDGIIGMELGETKDVTAKFPDTYSNNPDLAGKEAVFTITLNKIIFTPSELTDELVKEYTDYDSLEAWENAAREDLAHSLMTQEMWDAYIKTCQVKEYPEDKIKDYTERMTSFYEQLAQANGMTMDQLLSQGMGITREEFDATVDMYAKNDTAKPMIAQAIADKEGIALSDEEYESRISYFMEISGHYDKDAFFEQYSEEYLRSYMLQQKVQDFMLEKAELNEPEETEAETTTLAAK